MVNTLTAGGLTGAMYGAWEARHFGQQGKYLKMRRDRRAFMKQIYIAMIHEAGRGAAQLAFMAVLFESMGNSIQF